MLLPQQVEPSLQVTLVRPTTRLGPNAVTADKCCMHSKAVARIPTHPVMLLVVWQGGCTWP